jgi:CDP-2,3-bis-(O-geranylgeranyl)-sn-glycerol synthase
MAFLFLALKLIYLLFPAALANMAPSLAKPLLSRLALSPLDGGLSFRGRPLLGTHKTWGGTLLGILAGLLGAYIQYLVNPYLDVISLLDYSYWPVIGFLLGTGAIVGDLVKSFLKRQLDIKPGHAWIPFDEIDFVVGAIVFLAPFYFPGWMNAFIILMISFIGHIVINLLGFYLRLRKKSESVSLRYSSFAYELRNKEGTLVFGTLFIIASNIIRYQWGHELYQDLILGTVAVLLVLDFLRARFGIAIPFYKLQEWNRQSVENIHPATFAMLGLILSLQLISFEMAMAVFSIFIYGNTAAALIGKCFGNIRLLGRKTLEGSVAMFLVSMIAGGFIIKDLLLLFILALSASVVELLLDKFPEELVIPFSVSVMGKFFLQWGVGK